MALDRADLVKRAENAKRETRYVDFKEVFEPSAPGDWCEIIKDVVAMANSGGGVIVFGVANNGTPVPYDRTLFLSLDPAQITDKVGKYTGYAFTEFEAIELVRGPSTVGALLVTSTPFPLVFTEPGTYAVAGNKQKTAFARGSIYFRHGAQSTPANSTDLRDAIERVLSELRNQWLAGMRKVVEAPRGARISVSAPDVIASTAVTATAIRITDDPNAPAYKVENPDDTHPFRQKELLEYFNARVPPNSRINSHDALVVRRVYGIDARPELVYHPHFGSPQYSKAFGDWLIEQHSLDPLFFRNARIRHKRGETQQS
ncbi:MAG TPA: RNA-binding domain-containing protein [Thermoanaerobaculia bacterium]|jgi:hypothetical protein|nr:RNA-binding domain-containing protein [Thermoanaerobaculia bacterium]